MVNHLPPQAEHLNPQPLGTSTTALVGIFSLILKRALGKSKEFNDTNLVLQDKLQGYILSYFSRTFIIKALSSAEFLLNGWRQIYGVQINQKMPTKKANLDFS